MVLLPYILQPGMLFLLIILSTNTFNYYYTGIEFPIETFEFVAYFFVGKKKVKTPKCLLMTNGNKAAEQRV